MPLGRRAKGAHSALNQSKWSKIISIVVVLLSIGMVAYLILSSGEIGGIIEALAAANKGWLVVAVMCYAGFILAEGAGLCAFLRMEGYRIKLFTAAHFSFVGMFYANLTPSATGGQPMQVYLMSKRKVPASVATSALTVRFFFNQLALVGVTLVLWLINREFVAEQLGGAMGLIIIGCVVNFSCVPLIAAIILNRKLVEGVARWGIRLLVKMHLCKNPEKWEKKAIDGIEHFHSSLMSTVRSPRRMLIQLAVSVVEMTMLLIVPLVVYLALHEHGVPWHQLLTVSYMLYVTAAYFPLPGATGAQEVGFKSYFGGLFSSDLSLSLALLLWRFATFYICLLAGSVDAIVTNFRKKHAAIDHEERIST